MRGQSRIYRRRCALSSCSPRMRATMALLLLCALLGFPGFHAELLLPDHPGPNVRKLSEVSDFSWCNCEGTYPGEIRSLSLKPDPVTIPGDVQLSVAVSTTVPLTSPTKLALKLQKEVLGLWIDVPCVDNIGSCSYDVCECLDNLIPPGEPCPEPLASLGIPCHCPFTAGDYSLPESTFYIPDVTLPSWVTNGDYRVTGTLSSNNQEVGCAKIAFSLRSSSKRHW